MIQTKKKKKKKLKTRDCNFVQRICISECSTGAVKAFFSFYLVGYFVFFSFRRNLISVLGIEWLDCPLAKTQRASTAAAACPNVMQRKCHLSTSYCACMCVCVIAK